MQPTTEQTPTLAPRGLDAHLNLADCLRGLVLQMSTDSDPVREGDPESDLKLGYSVLNLCAMLLYLSLF
jgi:hypothetical protein